jgi:glycosyltransferase domain-containing protein
MSLDNGNNKTTIIISAHNRPNYLKRILAYYNEYGSNFKIIVADSSSNENKKLNKEITTSIVDTNILYLKYPEDIKPFYYAKNADALNYVKTKYCVNCADDDFITPNSINKSIEFLENNLDYTCVHGDFISFFTTNNNRGSNNFYWSPIYHFSESVKFSNPKDRLLYQFSNYMQTIYSIHRTNFLKMIFKETIKYTDDDRFGELLPSMLDLVYGKMKKLDVLYSARESIIDSAGRTSKDLNDFIKDKTYKRKYNKFRECLVKHLIKNSKMNSEESKKLINEAMSIYFKKYYSKGFKGILISKMSNLLDALDLPESINKSIRMLYRKIFTPRYVLNRSKEIDDFKDTIESPTSKYFDDFNKIRSHVLLYAKNNNKNIKETICN